MSIYKFFRSKQNLHAIIFFICGFLLSLIINIFIFDYKIDYLYIIFLIIILTILMLYLLLNIKNKNKILLPNTNDLLNKVDESVCRRKTSNIFNEPEKRISKKDRRITQITYNLNNLNVLIIEEDQLELQILKQNLENKGLNIKICTSGIDALKQIDNKLPDLILLDIMIPQLNGYDTVKKIRKKYSKDKLPVIFLTGKNKIRDIETGFRVGANDYIIKPFSLNELLTRINFHITFKNAIEKSKKLLLLQNDIKIAKKIHLQSIPDKIPNFRNFNITAKYFPMNEIGGDFYNLDIIDENNIGIFISDVSGHGVAAALIAAMIRIVTMILKQFADKPDKYLEEMNKILLYNIEDQFITAAYHYIDYNEKKLYYARAGHEPLIIVNKNSRKIKKYQPGGKAIGWYNKINCKLEEIDLKYGDRIICYSDGITNAINKKKKSYGASKFKKIIRDNCSNSTDIFISNLFDSLQEWRGNLQNFKDDMSIIVIDIKEPL